MHCTDLKGLIVSLFDTNSDGQGVDSNHTPTLESNARHPRRIIDGMNAVL